MHLKIYLSFLIIISLLACDNEKEPENKNNPSGKSSQEILNEFNNAYNQNSDSLLLEILNEWNQEYPAKEISKLSDGVEKAIYEIFLKFYDPFNINKYGTHEWGNSMYAGYNYTIVQNKIYYYISDGQPDYENPDSICDFRPAVRLEDKTTLYLTPTYDEALNYFLNPDYDPNENPPLGEPISEEGWNHFEFIASTLAILPGHWGGYWHIETHPQISNIEFNTALNSAKINFRIGYMFGDAVFEKRSNGWIMISSSITGIE